MRYNPIDWYWIVGGNTSKFYSSKRNIYVAPTDADYVAWASGVTNAGTPIDSEASLAAVLQAQAPALIPAWMFDPTGATTFVQPAAGQYTTSQLSRYANLKQWTIAIGGYTATVAGTARLFETDTTSMLLITGKQARLGQPNPPTTINWQFPTVGFVSIAAADFTTAATKIADFVQATFDYLDTVLINITNGTLTSTAAIDAAAWPANHD